MSSLLILIPVAVFLGLLGLAAFMWGMQAGQLDDLDGAATRILFDEPHARSPTQAGAARDKHRSEP